MRRSLPIPCLLTSTRPCSTSRTWQRPSTWRASWPDTSETPKLCCVGVYQGRWLWARPGQLSPRARSIECDGREGCLLYRRRNSGRTFKGGKTKKQKRVHELGLELQGPLRRWKPHGTRCVIGEGAATLPFPIVPVRTPRATCSLRRHRIAESRHSSQAVHRGQRTMAPACDSSKCGRLLPGSRAPRHSRSARRRAPASRNFQRLNKDSNSDAHGNHAGGGRRRGRNRRDHRQGWCQRGRQQGHRRDRSVLVRQPLSWCFGRQRR